MDSIKKTTNQAQHNLTRSQNGSSKSELTLNQDPGHCKHGTNVGISPQGATQTWNCEICEEELAKKIEMENTQDRIDREKDIIKKSYHRIMNQPFQDFREIPKRFQRKHIFTFQADTKKQREIHDVCQKYVDNFEIAQDKGTSMVFCGSPGTGKTHLAYGIAMALQAKYLTAVVTTASDMTSAVKTAYKTPWPKEMMSEPDMYPKDVIEQFADFDLLIIDEVGIQTDSEAEKRIFFEVINKRYEEMEPTIIMSNLTMDELKKFIGERVIDRMREGGGMVFAFDWGSYRK